MRCVALSPSLASLPPLSRLSCACVRLSRGRRVLLSHAARVPHTPSSVLCVFCVCVVVPSLSLSSRVCVVGMAAAPLGRLQQQVRGGDKGAA